MTAEELLRIPDDDHRYELVDGVLICMTPAGARHGDMASAIDELLRRHVRSRRLGCVSAAETGYILKRAPDLVRAPDVGFVRRTRVPRGGPPEGFWPFAPDLAVEVLSPDDRASAVQEKVRDYLRHGTRQVWVVDPAHRTVTVHEPAGRSRVLEEGDTLTGGRILPGFRCRVADLFAT